VDLTAAPARWPALDVDALLSRNPNFWRAYFEIAPGDSGLMALHAGLLLTNGEAVRASHLLVVAGQRPGVPRALRQGFATMLAAAQKVPGQPDALVRQGIELHDKGQYAEALKQYKEALKLWPQNGFAHYERGLTLRVQELVAAGEKPPKPGTLIVNGGPKQSAAVSAVFAKARRHDPFQIHAYQGDDPEILKGLLALAKTGVPAWEKLVKNQEKQADDTVL
jgi:tetratricopeptide (TPR) repeat protein